MSLEVLVKRAIHAMSFGQDRRPLIALVCEHPTTQYATISAFGDVAITKLPTAEDGIPIYCGDCIAKMSCQCTRCGKAIFVGDPVCLVPSPQTSLYVTKEAFGEGGSPSVGCMRTDCAPPQGSACGVWSIGIDGQRGQIVKKTDDPRRYLERMKSRRKIF